MNKKGTIGITIVMVVFCLLMAVSMSYHKTLQTENMIKDLSDYSDRAMDAAFSGVNYAMAFIQSNKKVFSDSSPSKITITNDNYSVNGSVTNYKSEWINLATTTTFINYLDEDRTNNKINLPPYRFKVACTEDSYSNLPGKKYILIKSYGEYLKYEENNIIASYSAQIMAKCEIATITRTIKLTKYRKMQPQIVESDGNENNISFFSFTQNDYTKDKKEL